MDDHIKASLVKFLRDIASTSTKFKHRTWLLLSPSPVQDCTILEVFWPFQRVPWLQRSFLPSIGHLLLPIGQTETAFSNHFPVDMATDTLSCEIIKQQRINYFIPLTCSSSNTWGNKGFSQYGIDSFLWKTRKHQSITSQSGKQSVSYQLINLPAQWETSQALWSSFEEHNPIWNCFVWLMK